MLYGGWEEVMNRHPVKRLTRQYFEYRLGEIPTNTSITSMIRDWQRSFCFLCLFLVGVVFLGHDIICDRQNVH